MSASRNRFGSLALTGLLGLLCFSLPSAGVASTENSILDIAINGGRLIDPSNRRDGLFNLGISDGKVVRVSTDYLTATTEVNATGKLVVPGFIDLHSHALSIPGQSLQVQDGVTTALELEAGVFPISAVSERFPEGGLLHFAASSSHIAVRQAILGNTRQPHFTDTPTPMTEDQPGNPRAGLMQRASAPEILAMMALHEEAIAAGALGIGLPLDYMSEAVGDEEMLALFAVAASNDVPLFIHLRRGLPGDLQGLEEVIDHAVNAGAAVHICHLPASVMKAVPAALAKIDAAREQGVRVTTETYPYNAGSTTIGAAVFRRNWRDIFAIDYADVQWTETGERLTSTSFAHYQSTQPDGYVVHHYGHQEWTETVLRHPGVMVASDAMPVSASSQFVHPRGIGTFARVLSRHVDVFDAEGALSLTEAIEKMTGLPAQLLAAINPSLSAKGQLGEGADADITVIDPNALRDRATYLSPMRPSSGIEWVFVCGVPVIEAGQLQPESRVGKSLNQTDASCQ